MTEYIRNTISKQVNATKHHDALDHYRLDAIDYLKIELRAAIRRGENSLEYRLNFINFQGTDDGTIDLVLHAVVVELNQSGLRARRSPAYRWIIEVEWDTL